MSTAVKEARSPKSFDSKKKLQALAEEDTADLALAMSRRNDSNREFISIDELISHLRK